MPASVNSLLGNHEMISSGTLFTKYNLIRSIGKLIDSYALNVPQNICYNHILIFMPNGIIVWQLKDIWRQILYAWVWLQEEPNSVVGLPSKSPIIKSMPNVHLLKTENSWIVLPLNHRGRSILKPVFQTNIKCDFHEDKAWASLMLALWTIYEFWTKAQSDKAGFFFYTTWSIN